MAMRGPGLTGHVMPEGVGERVSTMDGVIFEFGEFELDTTWQELRRAGTIVRAPTVVLRLLEVLVRAAPAPVSRDELLAKVWQGGRVGPNALTVAIARVRTVLGQQRGVSEFIATLNGKGYRFLPTVIRVGQSPASPRPVRTLPATAPRPIVGRTRELEVLRSAMDDARSGRGSMWVLKGEAGVGKSYVIDAFEREQPTSEVCIAWGFCRELSGTPPLWPWLRIVREIFSAARLRFNHAREHAVLRELERLRGAIDQYDRGQVAGPCGDDLAEDELRSQLLSTGIVRLILLASTCMRLLILLEDLHRADLASLALLSDLLGQLGDARVLIVATLSPLELAPAKHAVIARLLEHPRTKEAEVERLGEREVTAYLKQVAGSLDPALSRAIYAGSRGNPFVMAELTRQWIAGGRSDATSVALTDVARTCMLHRITLLSHRAREFLSAAAVVGRSFELPMLASITGLEPAQLAACVEEAISVEVCIGAVDATQTCAFAHEVQRQVLYEELSPAARRSWHLRTGRALATRSALGAMIPASEIAHHFFEALPETDLRQTVHWCREAARAAAEAFAYREAVRHTKRAFEALELVPQPSVRLRMHLLDQVCLFARASDATTYRWAARTLLALALRQRDPNMIVRAALMLNQHPGFQPLGSAVAVLERALAALPEGDLRVRACALSALAASAPICFTERAYALVDEAMALASTAEGRGARPIARLTQLYLYGGPAHADRAREAASEAELLGHESPRTLPMLSIDVALHRAIVALQRGDRSATRGAIDGAMIRARKLGNDELLWYAERFRALTKLNTGRMAQGITQLDALHHQAETAGLFGTDALCAFDRAVSMRAVRPAPQDDGTLRNALGYEPSDPPSVWSMKLRALAALGLLDEARTALHSLGPAEMLRRLPCDAHYLGTLGHVAHAVVRLGERSFAETVFELLSPFESYFSAQQSFHCEGAVPHVRGMLARALGRYDEGIALLSRGITMNERTGLFSRAAEAKLELSRCLCARGRKSDRDHVGALVWEIKDRADTLGMYNLSAEVAELVRDNAVSLPARRVPNAQPLPSSKSLPHPLRSTPSTESSARFSDASPSTEPLERCAETNHRFQHAAVSPESA